jgi:hypothetical protein
VRAGRRLQGEHAPTIVAARVELTDESGFFHALQRAVDRAGPIRISLPADSSTACMMA